MKNNLDLVMKELNVPNSLCQYGGSICLQIPPHEKVLYQHHSMG